MCLYFTVSWVFCLCFLLLSSLKSLPCFPLPTHTLNSPTTQYTHVLRATSSWSHSLSSHPKLLTRLVSYLSTGFSSAQRTDSTSAYQEAALRDGSAHVRLQQLSILAIFKTSHSNAQTRCLHHPRLYLLTCCGHPRSCLWMLTSPAHWLS